MIFKEYLVVFHAFKVICRKATQIIMCQLFYRLLITVYGFSTTFHRLNFENVREALAVS